HGPSVSDVFSETPSRLLLALSSVPELCQSDYQVFGHLHDWGPSTVIALWPAPAVPELCQSDYQVFGHLHDWGPSTVIALWPAPDVSLDPFPGLDLRTNGDGFMFFSMDSPAVHRC
uniref:Uncharacterized protein n=2 Tax=Tetraodon nigroviridis TaxID=99883 RepID=H3DQ34_TETNG